MKRKSNVICSCKPSMTDLGLAGQKLIASGINSVLLSETGKATNIPAIL